MALQGEPVAFISQRSQQEHRGTVVRLVDGCVATWNKHFLFTFRQGANRDRSRVYYPIDQVRIFCGLDTVGRYYSSSCHPSDGGIQLSRSSINHYQVWKTPGTIFTIVVVRGNVETPKATLQYFFQARIIINSLHRLDVELAIMQWDGSAVDEYHSGSDGLVTLRMTDILSCK